MILRKVSGLRSEAQQSARKITKEQKGNKTRIQTRSSGNDRSDEKALKARYEILNFIGITCILAYVLEESRHGIVALQQMCWTRFMTCSLRVTHTICYTCERGNSLKSWEHPTNINDVQQINKQLLSLNINILAE